MSVVMTLAACGGSSDLKTPPDRIAAAAFPEGRLPFAEGPIGTACRNDQRARSSRAHCGCVQAAADLTLTQNQQKRGTTYFGDPGRLQEVRQSDAASNERFWSAWTDFADTAQALCTVS